MASVIGTVEAARVEGDQIIARLRFSSRPEIESTVRDIRDGILANLSIGYSVSLWADGEASGRRQRIARKWKPVEVSVVAVPADHRARVRQHEGNHASAIIALGRQCGAGQAVIDGLLIRGASIEQARETM